ncbi:MAG: glycosyltransferase [Comamonadaceae bacterium]|nr:MAG: glycosyltransferase [Comamonadaceae bacterium]
MKPLKIAFVSLSDAGNVRHWSGTTFHMAQALAAQPGVTLVRIDDLEQRCRGMSWRIQWLRKAFYRLAGQQFDLKREPSWLKSVGARIREELPADTDIVFADSSLPLAFLDTKLPMAFLTDACFDGMLDFYFPRATLPAPTLRHGQAVEQRALDRCGHAFYASDWAAGTAAKAYGVPAHKLHVVPLGANLATSPTRAQVAASIAARPTDRIELLLCGVEWERKGGDFAVDVVRELNAAGTPARLHVCGIRQLPAGLPDFVVDHGFLNKGIPEEARRFDQLFEQSHLLLVPTRAEAFGLVFCEASAFGLPSVTTDVGGIPTVVREGENGKTFPLTAPAAEYAAWITALMADRAAYDDLAMRSFETYERRLNWTIAARDILATLRG